MGGGVTSLPPYAGVDESPGPLGFTWNMVSPLAYQAVGDRSLTVRGSV